MAETDRLVVVTYDAGTNHFTVNPNPVTIPQGEHKLYFALQTINKGDSDQADFTRIEVPNTGIEVKPLDGFRQLYMVTIDNTSPEGERLDYNVECEYDLDPHKPDLDPTIILQPPSMPQPSA